MYDLSGLRAGQMQRVKDDWRLLVDRMRIGRGEKDRAYLHHDGKPVVAVWGVGFNDGRRYTLAECEELIHFLKHDNTYEGPPSDHYLWLTGMGARLLRGEIKPTDVMPLRYEPADVGDGG
jgi:hypothetical protein